MSSDLAQPFFLLNRPAVVGGALVLLVALVAVVALLCRPLMPVDETRYLAVAWEMWRSHEFLVPHLLGEPYHHKPPLLFWLIHAGWVVFGPVEWWARLVPALCALACLGLTAHLARALWPSQRTVPLVAAILLVGCPFWLAFATIVMFDGLLAACVLLGVLGLVRARQDWRGWVLVGLSIGLGVLAKGPVVLLHLLPPALLAPWWLTQGQGLGGTRSWWRWYLGLLAALLGGAALGLAWALPAAAHGGDEYRHALLWGQSVARITGGAELNAHARSWWWYLPFLPALFFPWSVWPPCWRAAAALRHALTDDGMRLLLCWVVPAFSGLCLIGGKQMHYLVPLLPAVALLAARGLSAVTEVPSRQGQTGIVGVLGFIGLVLTIGPHADPAWIEFLQAHNREASPHAWAVLIPWWCGPAVLLIAVWAWWLPLTGTIARSAGTAAACVGLALALHLGIGPVMRPAYDAQPISTAIAGWRSEGLAVARVAPYAGEYEFAGRLSEPLTVISSETIADFAASNPHGRLLLTFSERRPPPAGLGAPLWTRPWRGVMLGAWDTATIPGRATR